MNPPNVNDTVTTQLPHKSEWDKPVPTDLNHPNVNDTVKVTIKQVDEMGLLVTMEEYPECDGFILLSDITRWGKKIKQKY